MPILTNVGAKQVPSDPVRSQLAHLFPRAHLPKVTTRRGAEVPATLGVAVEGGSF